MFGTIVGASHSLRLAPRNFARQFAIQSKINRAADAKPAVPKSVHIDRREAMLSGMALATSLALFSHPSLAVETSSEPLSAPITTDRHVSDAILAYEFDYPVVDANGKAIPMVFSRKPERYSSAAPLTADARQRIVCELAGFIDAVTVSVSVGPPAGSLRATPATEWTARQVAEQVLADRSTARITSGQRVSLNSVEDATKVERDGVAYFIYEHVSQGSPTMQSTTRETYRHSLAVTAMRPGLDGSPFLYTLNMACPQQRWAAMEEGFKRGVSSFSLPQPGSNYVAPDQDSWRFF